MKNWLIGTVIVLLVALIAEWQQVKYANDKWEKAEANVKSYSSLFDQSRKKSAALQLTCEQLNYFKDSVLEELNSTRKELKIKDKNLKALQAVSSKFSKKDTIYIPGDTIFKEPSFTLDTLVGDKWYSVRLGLQYPSMVAIQPEFKSEKHIIVSSKKETINPPSKFFLFRWFQRKHTVLEVNVKEKNPYVDDESSRYIEIIK